MVHRGEHLRARTVVPREREQVLRLRPSLAEHLDVRVPEAVDRLELVAHREDLRELGMSYEIDELALQSIRVLELVDHHHPEPELRRLAHGLVIPQEIARGQLEILEVDGRLPALGGRVLGRERSSSSCRRSRSAAASSSSAARSAAFRAGSNDAARAPLAAKRRQIDRGVSGGDAAATTRSASAALRRCVSVADVSSASSSASARSRAIASSRLGALAELEHELATRRAQRLEDAGEHSPQAVRAVGREQPQPLGVTA